LQRIAIGRQVLLDFFRGFIRCPSPNPPGDTRDAAGHIRQLLAGHDVEYGVIAPNEMMPNIVATFDAGKPGRHLALNGHIDVFPVGDGEGWTRDPWGRELVDGRIYLQPRRLRQEVRHHRIDLHLPVPAGIVRRAPRPADLVGTIGRGDLRPVWRPLPIRASPGRGFWTGESPYAPRPPSIKIVRLPLSSGGGLCSFDV